MTDYNMNSYAMGFGAQSTVVQVKGGFLAQIFVCEEIVWERGPFATPKEASEAAIAHVKRRAKKVFA